MDEVFDGLQRQIRINRRRAVTHEKCHVVDFAHVTRLDQQADLAARLGSHQVMVNGGAQQQRRNRCLLGVAFPVGQDDEALALADQCIHLVEDLRESLLESDSPTGHRIQPRHARRSELRKRAVRIDVQNLREFVVVDHGERQEHLAAMAGLRFQQVAFGPDEARQTGDDFFTNSVQRGVGHLREELAEVVEQQTWPIRQRSDRSVGTHRTDRFRAGARHRLHDHPEFFLAVPEGLLPTRNRFVGVHDVLSFGQFLEVDDAGVQPLVVRQFGRKFGLDLVIFDDAARGGVNEEHSSWLQPSLAHHRLGVDVQHASLGRQHHQALVGDPESTRSKAVAVKNGTDLGSVGEADVGGAVPRLHERRVELVERASTWIHVGVVLPGLGNHHQDGLWQRAATEVEQFQDLVEAG